MKVYHYDAFATEPNKGNPAGVVLDADRLTDRQMQGIAAAIGFNETGFVCASDKADIRIRFFTPGHEMNLCGHGTVASLVALYEQEGRDDIKTIETKAGVIAAGIQVKGKRVNVIMEQIPATFIPFTGNRNKLADVLGIHEQEIDSGLPIVFGSTGIWTLLVPIKTLESFKKMSPRTAAFPEVLPRFDHASIHPFCLEVFNPNAHMHGRHFSSPFSGTIEDPVTGTASGVMGAYHLNFITKKQSDTLVIEQGQEIGRNGFVTVDTIKSDQEIRVKIQGTGAFVKEILPGNSDVETL